MIKSKFAFGNVYGVGVFLIAFLAIGIYFLLNPHMPVRNKFGTTTGAWIPGLVIVGAGLFLFYVFQRKIFFLHIYPDKLGIKSLFFERTIYKQDITSIDVWGREDIGFTGGNRPISAIIVTSRGNQRYVLADRYYRNAAALKLFLCDNFTSMAGAVPSHSGHSGERMPAGEEDGAEKFAGYALLSFSGAFFVMMTGGMIIAMITTGHGPLPALRWVLPAVMFLLLYPITGLALFYVKVSDKYLIVRNHFFPWYSRGFRLEDIVGVVFGRAYKGPNGLRINLRNFHSKKYQASSLRTSDWRALEQRLKEAGIEVRNEI